MHRPVVYRQRWARPGSRQGSRAKAVRFPAGHAGEAPGHGLPDDKLILRHIAELAVNDAGADDIRILSQHNRKIRGVVCFHEYHLPFRRATGHGMFFVGRVS